jgi:hypothetical protein
MRNIRPFSCPLLPSHRYFSKTPKSEPPKDEAEAQEQLQAALNEWHSMSETEKLKTNPNYLRSPMQERGAMRESDHLIDNAWVVEPLGAHKGTLVWLHGLGKGVDEMRTVFELLKLPGVRVVVPHAPLLPITALDEDEERTWFDIENTCLSEDDEEDRRGVQDSTGPILDLIDEEVARLKVAQQAGLVERHCVPLVVAG